MPKPPFHREDQDFSCWGLIRLFAFLCLPRDASRNATYFVQYSTVLYVRPVCVPAPPGCLFTGTYVHRTHVTHVMRATSPGWRRFCI